MRYRKICFRWIPQQFQESMQEQRKMFTKRQSKDYCYPYFYLRNFKMVLDNVNDPIEISGRPAKYRRKCFFQICHFLTIFMKAMITNIKVEQTVYGLAFN